MLDKVRDYLKQLEEKRISLEDTPDIVHVPISTKQVLHPVFFLGGGMSSTGELKRVSTSYTSLS